MAKSHQAGNADYERLKREGKSDEQALIGGYQYEDKATENKINEFRKGGMTDKDIEQSGIYKFKKKQPPQEGKYSRAKKIISKAIGNWKSVKKPAMLTQKRKYTNPTESE
jgi:hypothetical protein